MHNANGIQNATMPSSKDGLREVEKAGQVGREASMNLTGNEPSQRTVDDSCTSMYIEDDSYYNGSFGDSRDMSWQSSDATLGQVKNAGTVEPRRNSVMMTAGGMVGLQEVDFDDSDDDDGPRPPIGAPTVGHSNPNHRPMVGGFAAAAYEAARADHYKKQQASKNKSSAP